MRADHRFAFFFMCAHHSTQTWHKNTATLESTVGLCSLQQKGAGAPGFHISEKNTGTPAGTTTVAPFAFIPEGSYPGQTLAGKLPDNDYTVVTGTAIAKQGAAQRAEKKQSDNALGNGKKQCATCHGHGHSTPRSQHCLQHMCTASCKCPAAKSKTALRKAAVERGNIPVGTPTAHAEDPTALGIRLMMQNM